MLTPHIGSEGIHAYHDGTCRPMAMSDFYILNILADNRHNNPGFPTEF